MATSIIYQAREYHLPQAQRRAIIKGSSTNPTGEIPSRQLAVVERQRLRFIRKNGTDGLGDVIMPAA